MDWAIYLIAGFTVAGLVLNAVLFFHYGNKTVHRGQVALVDVTVLMLCFSILSGGARG